MAGFEKILIANRGEIAVRIARTARALGYRSVAVYSDADRDALHVNEADEAMRIGPAAAAESYLAADMILEAAAKTGADAIHPGYGFLAENAGFARACASNGIVFIGPGADAIELMGNKRLAKLAMIDNGVPCIPGYEGADQDDGVLIREARRIGFPLMVKASAGGGGRGMRLVGDPAGLAAQIKSARSEALSAFGSGELILERAISEPRHIEIQVFADSHGNVVHLGERDCSIQRRHQKVIEESPSPFMDDRLRRRMGETAVNVARSCGYLGAGTVEFLVDGDGRFFFLEMNTRLQVEHPVTEMVTGQDLVAWQLQVAAGRPLPLQQSEIVVAGHAIEARLCAEDPRKGFLPQTGLVHYWDYPLRADIRVDHGIDIGQEIGPHYDSLLAKIVAHGDDRETALRRLASALQDIELLGVNNNRSFLKNICAHPVFAAGEATTSFIDAHFSGDPSLTESKPSTLSFARAALLYHLRGEHDSPQRSAHRWGNVRGRSSHFKLQSNDAKADVSLREEDGSFRVTVDGIESEWRVSANERDGELGQLVLTRDDVRERYLYVFAGTTLYLDDGSGHRVIEEVTHRPAASADAAGSGKITASMDGAIVEVLVKEGDTVAQGQTIVVLEAMKMEHHLKTGVAGTVETVDARVGEQVKARQQVASIAGFDGDDTTGPV